MAKSSKTEDDIKDMISSFIEMCKSSGDKPKKSSSGSSTSGALYFVGFIGALVYYMQAASGFATVITGILKAAVWPAYIVYNLLESFYGVVG